MLDQIVNSVRSNNLSLKYQKLRYRVSQKTWEFSDELDIVFVMNLHFNT